MRIENVVCGNLKKDQWLRLATRVDSSFIGSDETFSFDRKTGYYLLTTNMCDDASFIRVYCKPFENGVEKITRLGYDTDGWQEIQPDTYKSVEKYLNEFVNVQ